MEENFKKINRSSLVQIVIDMLTKAMLEGRLKPGDKIPTEMELSEQMGIARNTVREAIKILVYMGVLEIRRPEGTFVTSGFTENLIDPMIYGIILNQSNEQELNELRATMETGVLRLAIAKYKKEDISRLHDRLMELKEAIYAENADYETVFEKDNAFHAAITDMSDNKMVAKLNTLVLSLTHATRYNSVKRLIQEQQLDEFFGAHQKVFEIVANREVSGIYDVIRATYFLDGDK